MTNISKPLCYVAAAVFATMSAVAIAAEQGEGKTKAVMLTQSIQLKATIVKINKKTRELTLRDESGEEKVIVADKEVRNFNQIKKGDIVVVEYHRAAASALQKMSDTEVAEEASSLERAPSGGKPGMLATHTSTIVATVLDVDTKARLLTVKGPRGGIVTIEVPADMTSFDSLKQGDKISAVYSEALAISVKPAPKKKSAPKK